jgi:glutathione S-transferase
MSEPKLTLYAESSWMSPWVFHAVVALEEKGLPYGVEVLTLPVPEPRRTEIQGRALLAKVPLLVDGDVWITESLAISEYLAERYPAPAFPRIFPADLAQRARARQVMSALRTGFFALREERQTYSVFGPPNPRPMSDKAKAEADELVRIASALIRPGATSMFGEWCIADADLALAVMRLVSNSDPVPQALVEYTAAQWARAGVRKFLGYVAASRA